MERGAIVLHFVAYGDFEGVPPVPDNCWAGHRVINQETNAFSRAVRIAGGVSDSEVIPDHTSRVGPRIVHVGGRVEAGEPTVSAVGSIGTTLLFCKSMRRINALSLDRGGIGIETKPHEGGPNGKKLHGRPVKMLIVNMGVKYVREG